MAKMTKQKFNRIKNNFIRLRIITFAAVMAVFTIMGLLMFLRPTFSQLEKRELSKFPKPTLSEFLDGTFFDGISTWYADTFPAREGMISANSKFEKLFGFNAEQIYGTIGTGDAIPDSYDPDAVIDDTEKDTSGVNIPPETEAESYEDGAIHTVPEAIGTTYISGNRAFSLYYFNLNSSNRYIDMLNNVASQLDGVATVYDMCIPTAVGVCLDEDVQNSIGSSNQPDTFDYIYGGLDSRIKTVDSYTALKNHNSEYIYFNTDHHWTALGAYYAYEAFCKVKGITPNALGSYETKQFPNFVGSYYAYSNQAQVLADNPDTVTAYIPKATNDLEYYDKAGNKYQWFIVYDVNDYDKGAKYSCFIGGDQKYEIIKNPNLHDGSSCVVIKESYGNAFVPFLVDHYETVHVVDYRYFDQGIVSFVKQNNIQDVIYINNADAIGDDFAVGYMRDLMY